ncbi:MAG: hypothetical protein GF310_04015 [candidate division Zixibacteria bacterium]|nr:hypothetical protein [candidate division Zixibacteria bacterium]
MSDQKNLIELMKIEWADIHHTRNQEWKILLIVFGVFYAIANITYEEQQTLYIMLLGLGILVCAIGAYINIVHAHLFYNKIEVIKKCEECLGYAVKYYSPRFSVQSTILLMYLLLITFLLGYLLWIVTNNYIIIIIVDGLIIMFSVFFCHMIRTHIKKKIKNINIPDFCKKKGMQRLNLKSPLYAEEKDIHECLSYLNSHPLKLIAKEHKPALNESKWELPKWTFGIKEGKIVGKNIIELEDDNFNFSVANEKSRQESHCHSYTTEIYISEFPMKIKYNDPDSGDSGEIKVEKGFIIVPPKIEHKVELNGLTYVFQASDSLQKVSEDKDKKEDLSNA